MGSAAAALICLASADIPVSWNCLEADKCFMGEPLARFLTLERIMLPSDAGELPARKAWMSFPLRMASRMPAHFLATSSLFGQYLACNLEKINYTKYNKNLAFWRDGRQAWKCTKKCAIRDWHVVGARNLRDHDMTPRRPSAVELMNSRAHCRPR